MRRNRDHASTIRGQLTRIVLIPSLCFLALWLVVAAVGTVQAVQLMGDVGRAAEGTETFSRAATELRDERRDTLVHLGRSENEGAGDQAGPDLGEQRESTDAAVAEAVALAERLRDAQDDEVERSAATVAAAPEALAETRELVDDLALDREEALLRFGELIDGAESAITALVHTTDGGENLTDAVLTRELMGAHDDYATADALLAGVIAGGEMSYEETAHFTYLTASYRSTLSTVAPTLHPSLQRRYESMTGREGWRQAEDLSRQVVTRTPIVERDPEEGPPPLGEPDAQWNTQVGIGATAWDEASAASSAHLGSLALSQAERTVDLAWSAALLRVALGVAAAVATLVGGVAAISVVSRSSRRLTDRLVRLRSQILDRDDDLPDIVERAQRGQKVDVQEELPPLDDIGSDEIGQVAEAFDSAQLTAVEAAVRQAEIRRGANRAYLGIAFRNQNLVQRQLRLLDEIEYNEQDPEALRRLFRLDHLATRARRYADNLIILGGGQSVRRWRQPRPLVDVLRAAIAETEDFDRVRLTSAPRVLMHGQAVADVVHLLAELVENATQFSPAGAPVDVSCAPVVGGLTVEVEDRGLGMSEHGYAAAERTLTQPPEFDVMELPEDPRLGLFVVARLAERHGIRVWLRPSSYGGTRATALLPESLLEPVESPVPVSAAPSGGHEASGGRPRPPAPTTGPQTSVAHEGAESAGGPPRPVHGAPDVTGPQQRVGQGAEGVPAGPEAGARSNGASTGPQWSVSVTGPQQQVGQASEGMPAVPEPGGHSNGQSTGPQWSVSVTGPQRGVGGGEGVRPGPAHGARPSGTPSGAPQSGPQPHVGRGADGALSGGDVLGLSGDRSVTGPQWSVSVTGPQQGLGGGEGVRPGPAHGPRPGGVPSNSSQSGPQRPLDAGRGHGPEHAERAIGPPQAPVTGPQRPVVPGPDGAGAPGDPGRAPWPGDRPGPARPWNGADDPAPAGPGHSARQRDLHALVALSQAQTSRGRGARQAPEGPTHADPHGDGPPQAAASGPQRPMPHHGPAGHEPRGTAPAPVPPYQVPDPSTGPRAPLPKRVRPSSAPPTGAQPVVAPPGCEHPDRPYDTHASRPTPPDGFGRVLAPDTPPEARDER
ncbi:signal transduction histidine kinase [Nocardiopsis sp. Huas11]|uniref:nitrate- and nitrite sensing domain-containing protein n=1 Tax=Nocardiopsis sp. Huas11 TaxID=2183912 RepID=UPI000F1A1EE8|nr:nitrate- and nitrite sensing domain-containing protein [Nocardiopsis sp. Huas11]RKS04454.1 signal transduction histidine kinase [Nocardiopsis sp. Huas11]